jgi:hypothetical protein
MLKIRFSYSSAAGTVEEHEVAIGDPAKAEGLPSEDFACELFLDSRRQTRVLGVSPFDAIQNAIEASKGFVAGKLDLSYL